MAIALQSQGTVAENTSAATTLNVPYPTSINSASLLFMTVSAAGTTVFPSLPSGWTQVLRSSTSAGTIGPTILVCLRQAVGTETGNLAVTTPSGVSLGQIIAFSGVDLTNPQDVTATTVDQSTASTSTILPTMTTTRPGCALVYGAANGASAANATPPTSPGTFIETADRVAGTRDATQGYLIWTGSGATGAVTVSWGASSARSIGALVALRPQLIRPTLAQTQAVNRSVSF